MEKLSYLYEKGVIDRAKWRHKMKVSRRIIISGYICERVRQKGSHVHLRKFLLDIQERQFKNSQTLWQPNLKYKALISTKGIYHIITHNVANMNCSACSKFPHNNIWFILPLSTAAWSTPAFIYDTFGYVGVPVSLICWVFVDVRLSVWCVGLCGCAAISLIGFVNVRPTVWYVNVLPSIWYVGLCGCMSVTLIFWLYAQKSDMLGVVGVRLTVWYIGLCGCRSVSLIFGVVQPSVWYVGYCRCVAVSLIICWAFWMYFQLSDMWVYIHQSGGGCVSVSLMGVHPTVGVYGCTSVTPICWVYYCRL